MVDHVIPLRDIKEAHAEGPTVTCVGRDAATETYTFGVSVPHSFLLLVCQANNGTHSRSQSMENQNEGNDNARIFAKLVESLSVLAAHA